MAFDIVVCFGENGCDARSASAFLRLPYDGLGRFVSKREGNGVCARLEGLDGLLMGERSGATERTEVQGAVVGRGRLAKDEELDEAEDEDGNGELAEEEALREGEAGGVSEGKMVGMKHGVERTKSRPLSRPPAQARAGLGL